MISKIFRASVDVLENPDIKKRYATVGSAETTTMDKEEFTKRIRSELERYRKVAAQVGIQQQSPHFPYAKKPGDPRAFIGNAKPY